MSAALGSYTYEMDASYAADFSREREPMKKRSRHPEYRRKGSAPTRVNGMHCRRNKRWSWGSGRGARMANLRAFAGCLAVAVVALASTARAVTIDLVGIANGGNAANSSTGLGSVSGTFSMSRTETTNAQYVEFLNKVDPTGVNPFGIYNASMGSNAVGGITKTGTVDGARYVLKSGAPGGTPAGTSYASMPVNFVSWFSAARFVNWLQGGQLSGTSTINTGVYTLGSATTGNIVARNPGATYFLPSNNEWYKAAFYNSTSGSYTLYPTNSNTMPNATVASGSLATPNTANWGNSTVTTGPVNVNAYVNTTSAYGLYGMWGNVLEMTDTSGTAAGQYLGMGGNYNTYTFSPNPESWDSTTVGRSFATTSVLGGYGFRVASSNVIAPVPEPETITLAAFGIVGLCGANWLKRRRKGAALPGHVDEPSAGTGQLAESAVENRSPAGPATGILAT